MSLARQINLLKVHIQRRLTPAPPRARDTAFTPKETPTMILPTCRCQPQNHANLHHPYCPSAAEPMPLNDTQLQAEAAYVGRFVAPYVVADILSRKDEHGNPLFPLLSQHLDG